LCYFTHLLLTVYAEYKLARVTQVEKVLGTSKVGPKYRVTLVKSVQEKLNVKIGNLIVFVEDEKGNILLRVSKLT
jgi:hypothetical protein